MHKAVPCHDASHRGQGSEVTLIAHSPCLRPELCIPPPRCRVESLTITFFFPPLRPDTASETQPSLSHSRDALLSRSRIGPLAGPHHGNDREGREGKTKPRSAMLEASPLLPFHSASPQRCSVNLQDRRIMIGDRPSQRHKKFPDCTTHLSLLPGVRESASANPLLPSRHKPFPL